VKWYLQYESERFGHPVNQVWESLHVTVRLEWIMQGIDPQGQIQIYARFGRDKKAAMEFLARRMRTFHRAEGRYKLEKLAEQKSGSGDGRWWIAPKRV